MPQRGRGRPSGGRESQLFSGGAITKLFSKIHLDITFTTEEHYIMRISVVPVDKAQCIYREGQARMTVMPVTACPEGRRG